MLRSVQLAQKTAGAPPQSRPRSLSQCTQSTGILGASLRSNPSQEDCAEACPSLGSSLDSRAFLASGERGSGAVLKGQRLQSLYGGWVEDKPLPDGPAKNCKVLHIWACVGVCCGEP